MLNQKVALDLFNMSQINSLFTLKPTTETLLMLEPFVTFRTCIVMGVLIVCGKLQTNKNDNNKLTIEGFSFGFWKCLTNTLDILVHILSIFY